MKKGYFFTLDAFIAMSILILCVILVFSIHSSKPYPMQTIYIADDIMYIMSSTKVSEVQSIYLKNLYDSGNISYPDATILEQIAVFHITGRDDLADYLAKNVTSRVVPAKYGYSLRIYNSTDEYNTIVAESVKNQDDARIIINSKKIVSGLINDTSWGPMTAEVRLWQ